MASKRPLGLRLKRRPGRRGSLQPPAFVQALQVIPGSSMDHIPAVSNPSHPPFRAGGGAVSRHRPRNRPTFTQPLPPPLLQPRSLYAALGKQLVVHGHDEVGVDVVVGLALQRLAGLGEDATARGRQGVAVRPGTHDCTGGGGWGAAWRTHAEGNRPGTVQQGRQFPAPSQRQPRSLAGTGRVGRQGPLTTLPGPPSCCSRVPTAFWPQRHAHAQGTLHPGHPAAYRTAQASRVPPPGRRCLGRGSGTLRCPPRSHS